MTEAQNAFLLSFAQHYIWWKTPNEAMAYPQRILAQVMNIGVWADMCKLVELFPQKDLLDVLNTAEIGQFNERSWHFWYNHLSDRVPPMPKRVLE